MNDKVFCTNCGTLQIVEKGSDVCLYCFADGCLQWMPDADDHEVYMEPQIIEIKE